MRYRRHLRQRKKAPGSVGLPWSLLSPRLHHTNRSVPPLCTHEVGAFHESRTSFSAGLVTEAYPREAAGLQQGLDAAGFPEGARRRPMAAGETGDFKYAHNAAGSTGLFRT